MRLIGVQVSGLQTIGTHGSSFYLLELGHPCQPVEHIGQVGIGEVTLVQQFPEVANSRRDRLDEMLLTLEIATEAIGSQNLQQTEEHEKTQTVYKMVRLRHLGILLQGVVVFIHQFPAYLMRIFGRGLPQE